MKRRSEKLYLAQRRKGRQVRTEERIFFACLAFLRRSSGQTFYDTCQVPSLFFSRCLAHLLSSNVGQVVIFIIRLMISPHYKNNLKPLRSQSSKRSRMTVPFSALRPIVLVRPLTSPERVKRKPVDGMSQVLVTGKSKKYHTALATGLGHGDFTRLGLEVAKGFPAIVSVAQLSPKLGNGGSAFSSRQGLYELSSGIEAKKRSTSSL